MKFRYCEDSSNKLKIFEGNTNQIKIRHPSNISVPPIKNRFPSKNKINRKSSYTRAQKERLTKGKKEKFKNSGNGKFKKVITFLQRHIK